MSQLASRLCYNTYMNKRRELARDFARTYFHISLRGLAPIPHEIREHVAQLKIVIVDTLHLTDGAQTLKGTWTLPGNSANPADTAHRATIASVRPLPSGLRVATAASHTPHTPADSGNGSIEWSAWHFGDTYELAVAGSIEEVLMYCDVTENEREMITMQARTLSSDGHVVYATARGVSEHTKPILSSLSFDGLIACELHLHPGTLPAIARLRSHGIRVIYMSAEPEDVATCVAQAAHINIRSEAARRSSYVTTTTHAVYARVTRITARKIVAALHEPHIISQHPLSELVDMLDACR